MVISLYEGGEGMQIRDLVAMDIKQNIESTLEKSKVKYYQQKEDELKERDILELMSQRCYKRSKGGAIRQIR